MNTIYSNFYHMCSKKNQKVIEIFLEKLNTWPSKDYTASRDFICEHNAKAHHRMIGFVIEEKGFNINFFPNSLQLSFSIRQNFQDDSTFEISFCKYLTINALTLDFFISTNKEPAHGLSIEYDFQQHDDTLSMSDCFNLFPKEIKSTSSKQKNEDEYYIFNDKKLISELLNIYKDPNKFNEIKDLLLLKSDIIIENDEIASAIIDSAKHYHQLLMKNKNKLTQNNKNK